MFAYCRNSPIYRVDISGTADAKAKNEDGEIMSSRDLEGSSEGGGGTTPASSSEVSVAQSNTHTGNTSSNPLRNITYTQKVLNQMQQGDHHSFPEIVDNYGSYGSTTTIVGGDGNVYYRHAISGSYHGNDGHFIYIWDANNNCNHRFFEVYK